MAIFDRSVLVVNQKAKIIEIVNEYAIFDSDGHKIGAVRQVGQGRARKVLRALTSVDQFLTTKLEVVDDTNGVVLQFTRPAKVFKSKVIVSDGAGKEIGQIVQQNMIGKIHFSLEARGQTIGSINAENWRAWDFNIQDNSGREVARIKEKVGGHREKRLHDGRQLRRQHSVTVGRTAAQPCRSRGALSRHSTEARQPRPQLAERHAFSSRAPPSEES